MNFLILVKSFEEIPYDDAKLTFGTIQTLQRFYFFLREYGMPPKVTPRLSKRKKCNL